jgi:CsoR family transcriptional regulator, copper-sensing transcriptional repressor
MEYESTICTSEPIRPPANEGATMTSVRDPERKRALVLRLKRVEGQLRGIQKLIEADADCEKVAQQLAAARKALDKTFFSMVGCVIAQGDLPPDDVADLLSRFS